MALDLDFNLNTRILGDTTPKPKKPIVLLVEDSQDDAFFFDWALGKSGLDVQVHHAWHGGEAIEFIKNAVVSGPEALPVFTFLDLKMPIVNGFDVLNWLREQPFAPQVPVVVLSGSDQAQDRELAFKLGAKDYLVKPIRAPVIRQFLTSVIANSEPVPSGE